MLKPLFVAVLLILCSGVLLARFRSLRQEPKPVQAAAVISPAPAVKSDVTEVTAPPTLARPQNSGSAARITGGTPIQRPDPVYPKSAIDKGIQGDVNAVMIVTESGVVADIEISSGNAVLAQSAGAALAHWRYTPFKSGGQPVAVNIPVKVSFRLNNEK
jgi:protein TonB